MSEKKEKTESMRSRDLVHFWVGLDNPRNMKDSVHKWTGKKPLEDKYLRIAAK